MAGMENKPKFPHTIKEFLAENIGATINFCDGKTPKEIIVAVLDDYLVTCTMGRLGGTTTDYRYTRIDSLEQLKITPKGASGVVYD